jgi:hypothetical protein
MKSFKKMSDAELEFFINSTKDQKLLGLAEDEYLRRMSDPDDEILLEGFDEMTDYEIEFMKKHWRPM